jgi:hypothetical protein
MELLSMRAAVLTYSSITGMGDMAECKSGEWKGKSFVGGNLWLFDTYSVPE